MKISVLQESLSKGLSTVTKAVDNKPNLPVLQNVLLEAEGSRLRLAATNLQMSITMWIGAKVDEGGTITLPAKTFADLVNNLSPERVDLNLDVATHTVHVHCGSTNSNIKGIDADEFPPITHGEDAELSIDAKKLQEMINQTAFAAAKDDTRPILQGVYTEIDGEKITMAAADGYRLAVRNGVLERPAAEPVKMVIPAKTLMEVSRIIDENDEFVAISLPNQRDIVTFHLENVDVSSQLLDGRFPDFSAIIPQRYITSTTMYTDDLLRACKRALIFARDNASSGRLYVKPPASANDVGEVQIVGKSAERGDLDGMVDASVEGEPLDISFNIEYLIEVLRVVNEERVVFQSNGPENPGVLRPEDRDDFVHVIMPMSR